MKIGMIVLNIVWLIVLIFIIAFIIYQISFYRKPENKFTIASFFKIIGVFFLIVIGGLLLASILIMLIASMNML
jgi:hypothetical protein